MRAAVDGVPPGVPRIRAGGAAVVRWAVEQPRPRPAAALAAGAGVRALPRRLRARPSRTWPTSGPSSPRRCGCGQLAPDADSDDAVRLYTVVLSGLISQQLANEPGVPFADGRFSRLTDAAIDLFLSAHTP